jgi:hypothetical protein
MIFKERGQGGVRSELEAATKNDGGETRKEARP